MKSFIIAPLSLLFCQILIAPKSSGNVDLNNQQRSGFTDAAEFGFSPNATGVQNAKALQMAVEEAGTVIVSQVGTYNIARSVYLPSNTTLIFGNNIFVKKTAEPDPFSHVFINKGAVNRSWDSKITIKGLNLIVNKVDVCDFNVAYGLNGQVAFFYAKDVRIEGFRCFDLGSEQFGIQICTFEDLALRDLIIKGQQDCLHLGRGTRFTINHSTFETLHKAIALNSQDDITSTPELGWIENGVIENCHDLESKKPGNCFCEILSGGWIDWQIGMDVRRSDTVVSNGKLYRVQADADGIIYKSSTPPKHEKGVVKLDGINWRLVQNDVTYIAGVRNVVFRDIFLNSTRTAFTIHFDNNNFNRSYYPEAQAPVNNGIKFDNIQVINESNNRQILNINAPVDIILFSNSRILNNLIEFSANSALKDYGKTIIQMIGCIFCYPKPMDLIANNVTQKEVLLKTTASITFFDEFRANVKEDSGQVFVDSDLPGLRK